MATVTNISDPNRVVMEGEWLGMKYRIIDFAFDASYATGGEIVTAASLGWTFLFGGIPLYCKNAAGSQWAPVWVVPNAAGSQVGIFIGNDNDAAAYAQRVKLFEAPAATDQSLLTARIILLGS